MSSSVNGTVWRLFRFSIDAEAWNARQAPVKPRARERSREVSSAFGTRARGANALALVEVSANDAARRARAREGVARESGGATHVNGRPRCAKCGDDVGEASDAPRTRETVRRARWRACEMEIDYRYRHCATR